MGQNTVWYANDYSELVIHWYKLLIENYGLWKANDFPISGMLDTLPRGSFASEFFLKTWLFYFFDPYTAIVINKILIHTLAYAAAYYFLSYFLPEESQKRIPFYSLIWAVIPFWPEAGIGIAFAPGIFLLFYLLGKGHKFKILHAAVIALYCFYSSLNLTGLFIAFALFFYGMADFLKTGKIKWQFFLALAWLTLVYCIFNFRLFDIYYFQRSWFIPHRVEYDIYSFVRYHDNVFLRLVETLFIGNIHAGYIPSMIYPVLMIFLLGQLFSKNKSKLFSPLWMLFLLVNLIAILSSLITYRPLVEAIPILFKIRQFSIERFYFLIYPLMVFSLLFLLDHLWREKKRKVMVGALCIFLIGYSLLVLDNNAKNYLLKPIIGKGERYPTYREFFAEEQFDRVRLFLEEQSPNGFKVGSLGFHPAISSYNGLRSIDGYTMNYPLSQKDKIYSVIKNELGPDSTENWLYGHFKGWGNKAYLFNQTHKDDFMRMKWLPEVPVENPLYNYAKLQEIGCEFLLAAHPIIDESKLQLLEKITHPQSAWDIYVYRIKPD